MPSYSKPGTALIGSSDLDEVQSAQRDRALVDRCLSGSPLDWDALYRQHQQQLEATIRAVLGTQLDPELVDELSAQVWYRLVVDDAKLLRSFDPDRGCRLSTFISVVARSSALDHFRSEKRRKTHEHEASLSPVGNFSAEDISVREQYHEFLKHLSPRERHFFEAGPEGVQSEAGDGPAVSDANRWQLASRIRKKWERFHAQYQ